jgi:polyribonucleotide nucleotidyltransferase
MNRAIPAPREEIAVRSGITMIKIPVDKIREIIGQGQGDPRDPGRVRSHHRGRDDGTVKIAAVDKVGDIALRRIEEITAEAEVGRSTKASWSIVAFGAFIEILPAGRAFIFRDRPPQDREGRGRSSSATSCGLSVIEVNGDGKVRLSKRPSKRAACPKVTGVETEATGGRQSTPSPRPREGA